MGELLHTRPGQSGLRGCGYAYAALRLRQWFCRKHKVKSGKYVRFSHRWLWEQCGLTRLALTKHDTFPWAKA